MTTAGLLIALIMLGTTRVAEASVSITVPASVNLGTSPTGAGTLTAQLGTIQVTAVGVAGVLLPSFTAMVSSTTFTTGGKTASETIGKTSVAYWSGPVTASSGLQTAVPGQATALLKQDLSISRTAFSSSGTVLTITTSWNPTIVITIPAAAVAGTYTGTITHSVA